MERIEHAVGRKQAEDRDRRGAAGTLVLAIRAQDRIMRENGAGRTEPIKRADEALTTGISSAPWTS